MASFTGFSEDLPAFLKDLENNNNKEWFDKNRKRYEEVMKKPLRQFVAAMAEQFAENGLSYISDPKKSLFRINRDIRFSKNKEPYKTNLGVFFPYDISQTAGKPQESVGLYWHFEPEQTFIAAGLHCPASGPLLAVRTQIAEHWQQYEELSSDKHFRSQFPNEWQEDMLKRIPRGFPKDHPAEHILRKKDFTFFDTLDQSITFSSKLADSIIEKAVAVDTFLHFLSTATAK